MKATICNIVGDSIHVTTDYALKDYISSIPGRQWDPVLRCWVLPLNRNSFEKLSCIRGVRLSQPLMDMFPEEEHEPEEIPRAADMAPIRPMPIKVKPFAHQVQGFNKALLCFGYESVFPREEGVVSNAS